MGHELLLEVGCEEIPARFLPSALSQLREKGLQALERAKIAHGDAETFGTPRRITLAVYEVAESQQGWEECRLGPSVEQAFDDKGKPTKAALGFARSCGVQVQELSRQRTEKGERLLYVKSVEGGKTAEVLADLLPGLIKSIEFEKSMRWGAGDLQFVRPIHWVLALFGGERIGFELDGIRSGKTTRGHRFTHPEEVEVSSVADYLEALDTRNVTASRKFRRETVEREVEQAASGLGGELLPDPGLMDEVTDLVEHPLVITGRFDPKYLELPAEVPIAAMRTHQRYFAVRKPGTDKELVPFFVTVANTPVPDASVVARGNERVLDARLADARFYWEEDLKTGIEKMRELSAGMVFYRTLGSYLEKTERVEKICRGLCRAIEPGDEKLLETAALSARYCKADLVSQMVGEFPELQGIMGDEYARAAGLPDEAARAIRDQYLPRSAEDIAEGVYPSTPAGDALSMADKLDSVTAGWAAGLAPTGAGDPFALRRQAQGVINLVLAKGYRLWLPEHVQNAAELVSKKLGADPSVLKDEVIEFFLARLRVQMTESGVPYDVVDACIAAWNGDLVATCHKMEAVARMKQRHDFEDLMIAFRRVMNIVEGEPGQVDPGLFQEEGESDLYKAYQKTAEKAGPLVARDAYDQALEAMAELKPQVDAFFDQVMVNVEEEKLRLNRHALCKAVADLFKQVADFSKIVIEGDRG